MVETTLTRPIPARTGRVQGWREMPKKTTQPSAPPTRPYQVSITLPDAILAEVQARASAKAIPPATLIRQWVAERVTQERLDDERRREREQRL